MRVEDLLLELLAVERSALELEIVVGAELEELERDLVVILQVVDERARLARRPPAGSDAPSRNGSASPLING